MIAAGISYIFNNNEQSRKIKYETVTVSSTIIDQQGILKYVIYPYSAINKEQKNIFSIKLNQLKIPIDNQKQINYFKKDFSIVFYWSIPLRARLLQIPTKSSRVVENVNSFQYHSMKISIGIQKEINENLPSEIVLSNSDDTLDSLSYNSMINEHYNGILKKKKFDLDEKEKKRFCSNRKLNEERNMILKNVNLCVENLSKILSQSCSNTDEQLTTLHKSSSLINNNLYSNNLCKHLLSSQEDFTSDQFYIHNQKIDRERLSDGIILHYGERFGIDLGEPMIRKCNINAIYSSHSINELNSLLSTINCSLMRQYQIESIEDLIRLFLQQGQEQFTQLMINLFKVDRLIVEQINFILLKWAKQLT